MALKFLNKKGWHTGSLRNIENVWKAEQKRDAEDKKLEELRKQIQEERERHEFRLLQEQAGLVPYVSSFFLYLLELGFEFWGFSDTNNSIILCDSKQERLDFLYDSGLAVGKGSFIIGTGIGYACSFVRRQASVCEWRVEETSFGSFAYDFAFNVTNFPFFFISIK